MIGMDWQKAEAGDPKNQEKWAISFADHACKYQNLGTVPTLSEPGCGGQVPNDGPTMGANNGQTVGQVVT